MKKLLILLFAGSLYISCNHNPQETGSSIIMEKERKDNPIEYQTEAIQSAPQTAVADSTAQMKSQKDSTK